MLPRIQLFQDLANHFLSLCNGADSFIVSFNGYSCSPKSVDSLLPYPNSFSLSSDQLAILLQPQRFDHLYQSSTTSTHPLFLFSSYQSDLKDWLTSLQSLSSTVYIRPFHSSSTSPVPQTRVGGYGVTLQIKNTEYKTIDDREHLAVLDNDNILPELETDVEGFLFSTLISRYPQLTEQLQQLKSSFLSTAETAESIPITQLKDIGLKAASGYRDRERETDLAQEG